MVGKQSSHGCSEDITKKKYIEYAFFYDGSAEPLENSTRTQIKRERMSTLEDENDLDRYARYTIQIGDSFSERLDRHISLLKLIEKKDLYKQQWVVDAIIEKLKKDEAIPPNALPKDKHLSLKINKDLRRRIENIVCSLKNVRRTYSAKQWIIEAISEKLSEDEERVKKLAREELD